MQKLDLFALQASLTLNSDSFKKGINDAKSDMASLQSNVQGLGGKISTVSTYLGKIGTGLNSAGKSISSFGNSISSIGAKASAVTAGLTTVLAASFTKAKSFIGTYESAMTVFTRKLEGGEDASKKLYNALVDVAKGSSFAQEHIVSAGQKLVAMGVDADRTTKYVQTVTNAIAGMGGSGTEIEEMAELFGKLSMQTNLYTQDINQMVTAGIPAWDILATKYGTTSDAVKEMAKQGLIPASEALDTITDALNESDQASEMYKYSIDGLAASLKSGTLTGSLDSLNTSFRTFALNLLDLDPRTESGKQNIEKLNGVIQSLGTVLTTVGDRFSFVGQWASDALTKLKDFLDNFKTKLDEMPQEKLETIAKGLMAVAAAGPSLLTLGNTIKTVGSAMSGLGTAFNVISQLGSGLAGLVTSAGGLGAAFGALLPIIGIVAAVVVGLIAVFTFLKDQWDNIVGAFQRWYKESGLEDRINSIKKKFEEFGEKLSKLHDFFSALGAIIMTILAPAIMAVMGIFNGLMGALDGLMTALGGIIDFFAGIGEVIVGLFTGDWEKVQQGLSDMWTGLVEFFGGLWDALVGWFSGILGSIFAWAAQLWDWIVGWLAGLWDGVVGWLAGLWDGLVNWFSDTLSGIVKWFGDVIEGVKKWASDMWEKAKETAKNFFNGIIDTIKKLPGDVWKWLSDVFEKVKNWATDMWDKAKETAKNFFNGIIDTIKKLPGDVWTWLSNVLDKVKTWASDMWDKAKEAALNVFNAIVDKIKEIPGKMLSIGKDIVEGLWNGINDMVKWITDKISGFCDSVMGGIKSFFGIESPSKLMRDVVGENLALGIGVGFETNIDDVSKDMTSSLGNLTKDLATVEIPYNASISSKTNAGLVNGLSSFFELGNNDLTIKLTADGLTSLATVIYDPLRKVAQQKGVALNA